MTQQWLDVVETAQATIMYGHVGSSAPIGRGICCAWRSGSAFERLEHTDVQPW
jgi:hypothetical protein